MVWNKQPFYLILISVSLASHLAFSTVSDCLEKYREITRRPATVETERQYLQRHTISATRFIDEFKSDSTEPSLLHPVVISGLLVANQRFLETRNDIPRDHLFQKQKGLNPKISKYFVLRDAMTAEERGLGVLIDGTAGEKTPVEVEFPEVNLRRHGGVDSDLVLMEVARLGIANDERGGLKSVFQGMAESIVKKYGDRGHIPDNLQIVLWTTQSGLTSIYRERYGFDVWEDPISLKQESRWVMGMTGKKFIETYLPAK